MECLATGDPPSHRRDTDLGLSRVDTKPGGPAQRGLGPQRHVADAGDGDRRFDRLANTRRRGIYLQLEIQTFADDVRRRGARGQRQDRNGN